jgi:hypothetical protein
MTMINETIQTPNAAKQKKEGTLQNVPSFGVDTAGECFGG